MLLVRMNVDLLMGEDLKKTGAGNLFTVFGAGPEIRREGPDGWSSCTASMFTTRRPVRCGSRDTDRIALWMIDTDHNGDSVLRAALLLHRWRGPVQEAEDGAQGRGGRRCLGGALWDGVSAIRCAVDGRGSRSR